MWDYMFLISILLMMGNILTSTPDTMSAPAAIWQMCQIMIVYFLLSRLIWNSNLFGLGLGFLLLAKEDATVVGLDGELLTTRRLFLRRGLLLCGRLGGRGRHDLFGA